MTIWKRLYGCHMATRTRTKTKKLRNKKSRNINCPAQLLVSIRTFVASSRTKPTLTLFDKRFPCLFQFRNHHNHLVDIPEELTTKPMGDDLQEAICRLLNKGHSCASAFQTLYVLKAEEYGPNYQTKITDRHNFARRNDISSIYKTHGFKEKYHRYLDLSYTIKNLEEMMHSYEETNGTLFKISSKDDSISICLSTPLMQRNVQQMSEVLYIEPSNDEFKEFRIYFILTETSVGALPISCILTNKHDMPAFSEGMKLFFEIIQIQPVAVLSNATIIAELVSQKYFPNSKKLLTFYHTVSAAWKVLYETRHELPRIKKESYYHLFREIVFASSEKGLMIARQVLAVECTHPKFLSFIDKMYENIPLWCMYYRQFMSLNGVSPFDYNKTEISFMIFRLISKIALERTKLFNINQITDFICSAFEKFYKNRILEMVFGKTSPVLEEKYGRIGEIDPPQMEDIGHHLYLFTKSIPELSDEYYQVDMLTDLCTCGIGSIGKHCDHVAETLSKCKVFSPELTLNEKATFYGIATGKLINQNEFSGAHNLTLLEERAFCSSPATIVGSTELDLHQNEISGNWSYRIIEEVENTKKQWMLYSNKISQLIEKDPAKFVPAVNTHLNNIEKYSTSLPMLLEGLYAGFPTQNVSAARTDQPPPLTIINGKNNTAAGKVKKVYQKSARVDNKTPPSVKKNSEKIKIHQQLFRQAGVRPKNNNSEREGAIVKHQVPVESNLELIWENINEPPTSGFSMEQIHHNRSLQYNLPVLEGNVDFLEEQLQDGEEEIDESMILEQFSNLDFELNPEPIRNPIRNESSSVFDLENTVYIDESALRHLARNELTIIDENQEILILPLETDYSLNCCF
ncbi:uncharacterized protein LOC109543611 [Dendroctonus ponderosae]|uniref:uncharacterized protein LOC109543611 n=1 Tax=Dendroctonus ponderosae TaxID=77166 RepID=UPI0020350D06|nr:uncharacterized protein LOC109543611 [Dendroctonus ponderosae]XP_048521199.1 uncharacterized protein LOC109543611 [Dendroctonus ponderosae]KAH1023955.1 hypothetical protein HUJ05_003525 [Dendroctonus ponderosae]